MATMQDTPQSRAARAATRARLYRLLANAYLPPGESLIEALRSGEAAMVVAEARATCPYLAYGEKFGGVPGAGSFAAPPDLAALRLEHTRLFADPRYLLVPCYESMYLDPSGGVMGEPARQVTRIYAAEGLGMAGSFHDLPDHISVELEFLAYLCAHEGAAWIEADAPTAIGWIKKEAAFLHDHLLQWLPTFHSRLLKEARLPFYHDISLLTYVFAFNDHHMTLAFARRVQGRGGGRGP
ncbi:MAG: molecular chaperone TorD family protein [Chloroflexi bacterium]|nr:molecular chaperone TorD family protein [Chloroflexota bacterium]